MIKLENLSKSFGAKKAVYNVTATFYQPGTVTILGPSGCGKTTLLRLIAGLERPDIGKIFINGTLASKTDFIIEPHKRNIGFAFQIPALWPHMSVWQNISFGLHYIARPEARTRIVSLLDAAELNGLENRYPHQLSGGEARRVSLIRTLAPRPRYLLMDEPLVNIDPLLRSKLLKLIKREIFESEACLIYVTHDVREATEVSSDTVHMENGVLCEKSV